jgi:regulator of protease activity HflC (stomatin/prohibitin superfamily)
MKTFFTIKRITFLALGIILLIVLVNFAGRVGEDVDAGEIVVIQDPYDGELHIYTQPGWQFQNFGTPTHYRKSTQFWFTKDKDQGNERDQSIKIRFMDGGHAQTSGSARWDMPLDDKSINLIHSIFGSQTAIENQLIRTVIEKSIYMTGPLMTSKESYAEKRNDLISYIEDQASKGVYKTLQKEVKGIDPMTNVEKTITMVEIMKNEKNQFIRQEQSPLEKYHINLYNLSINSIDYDENVERQIVAQQNATMQVQTAIAKAKEAEQRAITVAKEGEANAAKAKWEQEVIKAQVITEAQQKKEVAQLGMEEAEFSKKRDILVGEGEAAKKRLAMTANGALEQKLEAWIRVNEAYAKAMEGSTWVPSTVIGGTGASSGSAANTLIDMMLVKTANQLRLDMSPTK